MLPVADHSGVDEAVVVVTSVEDVGVVTREEPATKKTMRKVAIKKSWRKVKKGDQEVEDEGSGAQGTTVVIIAHDASMREMIKKTRKEMRMMMRINHHANALNEEDIEDVAVVEAEAVVADSGDADVAVDEEVHEGIMMMKTVMEVETPAKRNMKLVKRNHHRKFLTLVMERVQCKVVMHISSLYQHFDILPVFLNTLQPANCSVI